MIFWNIVVFTFAIIYGVPFKKMLIIVYFVFVNRV
jgi:hypothetical protein